MTIIMVNFNLLVVKKLTMQKTLGGFNREMQLPDQSLLITLTPRSVLQN